MDYRDRTTEDLLSMLQNLIDTEAEDSRQLIEQILLELSSRADTPKPFHVDIDTEWESFLEYMQLNADEQEND